MVTVELSDHPGDLLTAARKRREAADSLTRTKHERDLDRIRQQRDDARSRRKWLTWLKLTFRLRRSKKDSPRLHSVPTDTEEILKAGIAGELRIARELGEQLDDDWTLFHGYRNARGEIDHLLIGPKGLWAIEVKNINATVRIDRDIWLADKYDRYGNAVDHYVIADRRGRSPSMQINQSADALIVFLRQRGQSIEVNRVVILIHPRSQLGQHADVTVHVAVGTRDLLRLISASPVTLDLKQSTQLKTLIEQDHKFHDKQKARKR
jgi:Nuclease-related domain